MKMEEKGIDKKLFQNKVNEIEHEMKCILEEKKESEKEHKK